MAADPTTLAKLDELAAVIGGYADPRRAAGEWKQVYRLLATTDLPPARVTGVVGMRQVAGLAEVIEQLRAPADAAPPPAGPDAETCKRALRTFRKRLAFARLDDESRISRHDPLSKSGETRVTAGIRPPSGWPDAVWKELVRQGKLNYIGYGLYELAGQT